MRRRWFQFSLRGFLIALTLLALCLGWSVECARKRGRAIDTIVAAGGTVIYDVEGDDNELLFLSDAFDYQSHFWRDLRRTPVDVGLTGVRFDSSIAQRVVEAVPVTKLSFHYRVDDKAWRHLENLNPECLIWVFGARHISPAERTRLEQALPNSEVTVIRRLIIIKNRFHGDRWIGKAVQ